MGRADRESFVLRGGEAEVREGNGAVAWIQMPPKGLRVEGLVHGVWEGCGTLWEVEPRGFRPWRYGLGGDLLGGCLSCPLWGFVCLFNFLTPVRGNG